MLKRALRLLVFPLISVIWLIGWVCYNLEDKKDRTLKNKNYSSFNSIMKPMVHPKGTLKYDKTPPQFK
jgi:hypothetical protein